MSFSVHHYHHVLMDYTDGPVCSFLRLWFSGHCVFLMGVNSSEIIDDGSRYDEVMEAAASLQRPARETGSTSFQR